MTADTSPARGLPVTKRWDGAMARDLIVVHFHADHRGTFTDARRRLGASLGESEVFEAVEGAVRLVFRSLGADYANPTRHELLSVVEALARKSAVWGSPPHAVERLSRRLRAVIDRAGHPVAEARLDPAAT